MSYLFSYLLSLIFTLTPAVIWLFFYFKKDIHPEPKRMILKVFILGMLAGCFAAVFETGILVFFTGESLLFVVVESFLIVALIEEFAKYFVVKIYVFSSPELDEPFDVMLYMVISALGFAAIENIVLFSSTDHAYLIGAAISFALLRFIGAVFLHTLASGTLGFFIALSFLSARNKKLIFLSGFFIAVAFHGLYNFAIEWFTGPWELLVPIIIIITLLIFTTFGFVKLKKIKSICKIYE